MPPTDTDLYEANMALLKKYHPHVFEKMASTQSAGEIFLSDAGKPNLRIRNKEGATVNLHDPVDPEAEIEQFLNKVPEDSISTVTLAGMGLGYTPMALLKQRPHIRHLAVFELAPGIFRQALGCQDLSFMLADPRLILSVSENPVVEEVLAPAARALQLESIHMLTHLPSFSVDKRAYEKMQNSIFEHGNRFSVGGTTAFVFGRDFLANRLKHLTAIHHNFLLQSLEGAFSGIPAIIVAGGPSLDKNIHLLPGAKEKAVIIAADTVLPALLSHGVSPDFVSAIDPQEIAYEKFADVIPQVKGVSLICMPWVAPKVPKAFPAERVFWTFSAKPIERWINVLLGGDVLTGGAGTVAHLNLLSAVIMGCSPIIFMGQDLSFPSDSSHAQHTFLTNRNEVQRMLASKKDMVWVEGIDGGRVPTNRAFYGDKQYFEKIISENPGHYINATEGGARIKGTEAIPLQSALDSHCKGSFEVEALVSSRLKDSGELHPKKLLAGIQAMVKDIRRLQNLIKKAETLTRKVKKEISNLQRSGVGTFTFAAFPKSLQQVIKEIDRLHVRLDKAQNIWQMVEEITREGLRQSERMKADISRLEGDPSRYLNWMMSSLERFSYINAIRTDVLSTFDHQLVRILRHHENEKKIRKAVKREGGAAEYQMNLARLYYESEDFILARKTLTEDPATSPDSAEVNFILGHIALLHSNQTEADACFSKAETFDAEFKGRIADLKRSFGDLYLKYSEKYQANDKNTFKKLILKGLGVSPTHKEIIEQLSTLFIKDLEQISKSIASSAPAEADGTIIAWHSDIEEHPALFYCLPPGQVSLFYQICGDRLMAGADHKEAAGAYEKASDLSPADPELHIRAADAFFAAAAYDRGIHHLNKATELDKRYALHWEAIGDAMQEAGQLEDAVSAYERCFITLPEKVDVLKKMGDCYHRLGHLDAAREAYSQLKAQL